jgi:serine-type D-Ala-D-Ala carboxypeptidase (penicillin-binding protein 5/6)
MIRLHGLIPSLALLLCGFGGPRLVDTPSLPSFDIQSPQLLDIDRASALPLSARTAVVIDYASNRIMYANGANRQLPPASTTKMMTALLTMEEGGLSATVTVSPLAAGVGGTSMNLAAGQTLTVLELLYGLLLPSGNDAAMALAQRDSPDPQAFVNRMNRKAAAIGLTDTHFVNPHGLDDAGHVSSAYDLAELARYALQHQQLFDDIVATQKHTIPAEPGHPEFDLQNLNQLLGTYPGADGVKTGTTEAAGQVLVGSVSRDGHRVLAVVMGSTDRYADSRLLLDHAFGDNVWLRPDLYFPMAMPVKLRDAVEPVLPSWEWQQLHAYLDPDAMLATFTLIGQQVARVPMVPR